MKNTISIWALNKKKGRHKTNRTKNTKNVSIPHKLPSLVYRDHRVTKKKIILARDLNKKLGVQLIGEIKK
jgi:hypothetical protein